MSVIYVNPYSFAAAADIVSSGLVLHLDAGNTASYPGFGTTWTDLSGNGNTGTLTNGPTYSSADGGSIVLDGTNDYVSLTNPSTLRNQSFTVSIWVNPLTQTKALVTMMDFDHAFNAPSQGWVIQSEDASTNRNYYLAWSDGANFQPVNGFGGGVGLQVTASTWQNLTYTKTGTSFIGYKNGTQIYTRTGSNANVSYVTNRNLFIGEVVGFTYGVVGASRAFKGSVSSTLMYNRALTAAEVTQNFDALRGRYGL